VMPPPSRRPRVQRFGLLMLTAWLPWVAGHRDGADGPGSAEARAVREWRHTTVAVAALSLALAAVVAW